MVERLGEMRKGRRETIEKGSRERIEIERNKKATKGNCDDNLKKRRNITTCLVLVVQLPQGTAVLL